MKYKIPRSIVDKFTEVGGRNYASDGSGKHVETLAYLLGHETAGEVIATALVFPDQRGHLDHVDDEGKHFPVSRRRSVLPTSFEFAMSYFNGLAKICLIMAN